MGGCFSSKRQGKDAPEGTAEADSSSASATANGAGAEARNERVNENETSVGSASGGSTTAVAPRDLAAKRVHERTQPHSNDAQHANLDREFQAALEERDRLKRELDSAYSERDTYAARLATTRDDRDARPAGGTGASMPQGECDADINDSPVQPLEKEVHKIEHEAKRLDRFIDSKLRETGCVISAATDQQPTPTQQEKEERASMENARK